MLPRVGSVCQVQSIKETLSTRLIDRKDLTSNRLIEETLESNSDVIDPQWAKRHAKFCYKHGVGSYLELVEKARKYGKNPKAMLGYLINKEMGR